MTGSEFARLYGNKPYSVWEAAALAAARNGDMTPRTWVPITVQDGDNKATLLVSNDYFGIGPVSDSLRLPLTPSIGQGILNLEGALYPTPLLDYRIWQQSPLKLSRTSIAALDKRGNLGANMGQYVEHSALADRQIAGIFAATPNVQRRGDELVSGHKKDIVVSNLLLPKKVVIHGWYAPPPAPDVYDDKSPWESPNRQPQQVHSNAHGDFYVDYSHGIRAVHPMATVNGQVMRTEDLYRHPVLSRMVSLEGPLKVVRYPSSVPVGGPGGQTAADPADPTASAPVVGPTVLPQIPSYPDFVLSQLSPAGIGAQSYSTLPEGHPLRVQYAAHVGAQLLLAAGVPMDVVMGSRGRDRRDR